MISEAHVRNISSFGSSSAEIIYISANDRMTDELIHQSVEELNEIAESYTIDDSNLFFTDTKDILKRMEDCSMIQYHCPYLTPKEISEMSSVLKPYTLETIFFEDLSDCSGAFVLCEQTKKGTYPLYRIRTADIVEIRNGFRALCEFAEEEYNNDRDHVFCSSYETIDYDPDSSDADRAFTDSVEDIAKEIREKVNVLRARGISEYIIESLFKKEETLSRLVVTKDYRILLPDYNNMEIHMQPLPKAVYLLFLNHPEGILFKELPKYRQELTWIYQEITHRSDYESISKSLDAVLDPTNNSINEKCSRIKEAFLMLFDNSLAYNYYITGSASYPKRIILDRTLVSNLTL